MFKVSTYCLTSEINQWRRVFWSLCCVRNCSKGSGLKGQLFCLCGSGAYTRMSRKSVTHPCPKAISCWEQNWRGATGEINPEYSLEGLMLKLKLQHFGHLMRRADSLERPWCWERLKAGGERGDRGWDGWMASSTQWTWVWGNSRRKWRTVKPGILRFMGSPRIGHDWATEQ